MTLWRKFSPLDGDVKPGPCAKCRDAVKKGYYLPSTRNGRSVTRERYYHDFDAPDFVRDQFKDSTPARDETQNENSAHAIVTDLRQISPDEWTGRTGAGMTIYAQLTFGFLHAGIGQDFTDANNSLRIVAQHSGPMPTEAVQKILERPDVMELLEMEAIHVRT